MSEVLTMLSCRFVVLLAVLALSVLGARANAQVLLPPPSAPVIVPGEPPPVPIDVVPVRPVPPVMRATRVLTVSEFASTFRPTRDGGRYQVIVQHPCTGCAVKVNFCLPAGCPRKIKASKHALEIRYGLCRAVVVRFLPDGTVRVRD
jgi:hypothetical protein